MIDETVEYGKLRGSMHRKMIQGSRCHIVLLLATIYILFNNFHNTRNPLADRLVDKYA
jgi:hypothetical protein